MGHIQHLDPIKILFLTHQLRKDTFETVRDI